MVSNVTIAVSLVTRNRRAFSCCWEYIPPLTSPTTASPLCPYEGGAPQVKHRVGGADVDDLVEVNERNPVSCRDFSNDKALEQVAHLPGASSRLW